MAGNLKRNQDHDRGWNNSSGFFHVNSSDHDQDDHNPRDHNNCGVVLHESSNTSQLPSNGIKLNPQEPSRIQLKLRESPSLIEELISTFNPKKQKSRHQEISSQPSSSVKLKASNIHAIYLTIGSWSWASINEGDLVVKFYFGMKKLVWEFLYGSRKKKIEIRWSQLSAINAFVDEDKKGRLKIELKEQPEYFIETDYHRQQHTQWGKTDDFTGGQASICRQHMVVFSPGVLDKNFKKLLQCDMRLFNLSRQPFPSHNSSPFFYNGCLDFSSVHGCSSIPVSDSNQQGTIIPYVKNLVSPTCYFLGPSSSNLPISDLKSSNLDETPRRISYGNQRRTDGVWEQSGNFQIQEYSSLTHIKEQDYLLPHEVLGIPDQFSEWKITNIQNLPNEANGFRVDSTIKVPLEEHNLDNSNTGGNGFASKEHNPWLCAVEAGSGGAMNHMAYANDQKFIFNDGIAFLEPISWLPSQVSIHDFCNGRGGNGINQMRHMIHSFDPSGGNCELTVNNINPGQVAQVNENDQNQLGVEDPRIFFMNDN